MKRLAPIAFVLGLAALAGLVWYAGAQEIGKALEALGWAGFALVCVVHIPVLGLLGSAWWSVGRDIPGARTWKFVWARFVRESAAEVLPFSQVGGVVVGARALALAGLRMLPVAVSMLADLTIELSAKLPYIIGGLALLFVAAPAAGLIAPAAVSVAITAAALVSAVIWHDRIKQWLERLALRMAARWPQLGLGDGEQIRPAFDRIFARDGRLALAFLLHLTAWAAGAFETWLILTLMGAPITAAQAVVIDSLVAALRTIGFMVPAAVGVQEGGYVLICGLFGIDPAVAVALSLVRRAREIAIGLPGLGAWQTAEGKRLFGRPRPPKNEASRRTAHVPVRSGD